MADSASAQSSSESSTQPEPAAVLATLLAAPERPVYTGGTPAPIKKPRYAWVSLLMIGKAYAPGAIVVAKSLRDLKTAHELVCMVTHDVPPETRLQLHLVYDRIVEVPYISHESRRFTSERQNELYNGWIEKSFTKWNCLKLTEYDRVMFVDADMVFVSNCDDLFDLRPPAATFSGPWIYPWKPRGGIPNAYLTCEPGREASCDLAHGARIRVANINRAMTSGSFVGIASLVLLEPSLEKYDALIELINKDKVFGANLNVTSGADEVSLAMLYAKFGTDWTNIHQRYQAIPWKQNWVSRDIRAYHYFGRKPWDMDPDEWSDLADWWKVANRLVSEYPTQLSELFNPTVTNVSPLDADNAQLRLTKDLRAIIISWAKSNRDPRDKARSFTEIDAILERWLQAMINGTPVAPDAWAHVYRSTQPSDDLNQRLATELAAKRLHLTRGHEGATALVNSLLSTIDRRLGRLPRPTGAAAECGKTALSYGSHFKVLLTPRIRKLVEIGGCDGAIRVALRYETLLPGGAQMSLPQAHIDHLYAAHRVRSEAFASPLNARLFGKAGASFCSIFPDTDAAFGSKGDFFEQNVSGSNWIVNPPHVEALMERAARHVIDGLDPGKPSTVFFIIPAWKDCEAYHLLHSSIFCAAMLELPAGRHYFENLEGIKVVSRAASIYFALSTESTKIQETLAEALQTILTD